MARHSGKNLKVTNGADEIDGVTGFDFEETIGEVDLTAGGDTWHDHDTTILQWSGTINMLLDHEAAAKQTLRAGDILTFSGYTEGDASGKSYISGSCSVITHKLATTFNGETTREYSVKGKGALTVAVVSGS